MQEDIFEGLGIAYGEMQAVYDDQGEVSDFVWTVVNNPKSLDDRMGAIPKVGDTLLQLFPHVKDTELFEDHKKTLEDGKRRVIVGGSPIAENHKLRSYRLVIWGKSAGTICTSFQEITALTEKLQDIKQQTDLLRAACDHAMHGIVLTRQDGTILYTNQALCDLLGYELGELDGLHIQTLLSKTEHALDLISARKLVTGEEKKEIRDKVFIRKDGSNALVSVMLSVTRPEDTGETTFIGHIRDVSQEREAAERLKSALEQAQESARLKSEFVANMSHEIRTPMNGVIGMAQALAKGELNEAQIDQVETILDSGQGLMQILNDILDFSKIDAGKIELSPAQTDLRHKLKRIAAPFETLAAERGMTFKLVVDPSVPSTLVLDPIRLRQCLDNLLSNAFKFTESGRVVVAVKAIPGRGDDVTVVMHVSDTGIGIARNKVETIFEVFAQADGTTTRRHGGTGLGLPIARKLARLMGGDLQAVSEAGKGSVFTLTVRAKAASATQSSQEDAADELCHAKLADPMSGHKILIVDDNRINRKVALTMLQPYGVELGEASDGAEALSRLERERFDVVLMDVHMPEMDGVEALGFIRADSAKYGEPEVIAATADAMAGDCEKYLKIGFVDYVSKPIKENELISAVTKACKRASGKTSGTPASLTREAS